MMAKGKCVLRFAPECKYKTPWTMFGPGSFVFLLTNGFAPLFYALVRNRRRGRTGPDFYFNDLVSQGEK